MAGDQSNATGLYQHHLLLTPGQAAELANVSHSTLRRYATQGLLAEYRTAGRHRRFSRSELARLLNGRRNEQINDTHQVGRTPAFYARVSTAGQAKDLEGQIERLRAIVLERENKEGLCYRDCASAFGPRVGLNKLVREIINGKHYVVFVETLSRLSRIPSLTRLFEFLCGEFGCKLVYVEKNESADVVEEGYKELVEFCHVLSQKSNSRRAAAHRTVVFSPELIERARELYGQGLSTRTVYDRLKAEGWKTNKDRPPGVTKVWRLLKGQPDGSTQPNSTARDYLADFLASPWVKLDPEAKTRTSILYSSFVRFLAKEAPGIRPLSKISFGHRLRGFSLTPTQGRAKQWIGIHLTDLTRLSQSGDTHTP